MKRISQSIDQLKPHYTAVVVGSGYGGGIAASRLARAGQSVCLLERGSEKLPGEYPNSASTLKGTVQVDTEHGHYGPHDAMFDIHMNDDITALVGCGLGGTSLINANVTLEVEDDLFELEHWPKVFRDDPTMLKPYYERARTVLDSKPYPDANPTLNKVEALQISAKKIGAPFYKPPIAVNFQDQVNPFGVYQPECNNCGDCCSGCNVGAKNTTLMNYLPDAHNHGAEIFTNASVRHVEKTSDGWIVHVESVPPSNDLGTGDDVEVKVVRTTVTADVVILAAGTLGSTEILSRSSENGLAVSPALGEGFSGNGDVLAFGYDNYWREEVGKDGQKVWAPINGVGAGDNDIPVDQMPGPCIAGIIDKRNEPDIADRLVVEEGVIPGAMAMGLAPVFAGAEALTGNPFAYGPLEAKSRLESAMHLAEAIKADPKGLAGDAYRDTVGRTQTYLVMSHDSASGRLELVDDRLRINWPGAGLESAFENDNKVLQQINKAIKGQFLPNPMWTEAMGRQLVTVHPVGGCRMADDWSDGVVNDKSQVYAAPNEVHDGLYVCDGAVIPGAVGVNPLLTISALAERSIEKLIEERGWTADLTLKPAQPGHRPGLAPTPGHPAPPAHEGRGGRLEDLLLAPWRLLVGLFAGLFAHLKKRVIGWFKEKMKEQLRKHPGRYAPAVSFTETMEGFVTTEVTENHAPSWERISDRFELGFARGKSSNTSIDFLLTLSTDDLSKTSTAPDRPMTAVGEVHCAALSKEPMAVKKGAFSLLPPDPDQVETWLMVYDLPLDRKDGSALRFVGHKYLRKREGSNIWTDLTKLFVTVTDAKTDEIVAEGIMNLDLQDLIRQASTFEIKPKRGWFSRIPKVAKAIEINFAAQFAGVVGTSAFHAYGGMLADLANLTALQKDELVRRDIKAPKPVEKFITTDDGFKLKLTRYEGGTKGPVIFAPGFSVLSSSFAIDTVDENIVEYLTARDYDVWLFAYRGSPDSTSSTRSFQVSDIAEHDWPAAIAEVHRTTGKDVQVMAHCVSSMTLLMSLLEGVEHVRHVICSQLTLHPVVNWLNYLKADLGVVPLMRSIHVPKYDIDFRQSIDMRSSSPKDEIAALKGFGKGGASGAAADAAIGDKIIDAAMWMVPVPEGEECTNPVCHRVFSIFGPSYLHRQLNHATHTVMDEMFGEIATEPFEQIAKIVEAGFPVDETGGDPYLEHIERLAMPIDFLAGRQNQEFLPETSQRTLDWLLRHNDASHYTRRVFEMYGHMDFWVGKTANVDIFPYVHECLERHN